MKFVKKKDEKRRDYIFQKDKLTVVGARFVSSVLFMLIVVVASTYTELA